MSVSGKKTALRGGVRMGFREAHRRFLGHYRLAVGPVEVVALLNVLLLCGMFWLASSAWVLQPGIRVRLPEAPFVDGRVMGARVLTLTREGLVFFDDERMELDQLGAALAKGAGPLLIEADAWTTYGTLAKVYALAAEAGVEEVVLGTRPVGSGAKASLAQLRRNPPRNAPVGAGSPPR